MRSELLTPVEVVRAAQAGDQRALEELIGSHLRLLYNVVGQALEGHADVDDVVQDTLVRVVRNLPSLRDPAQFRPWLVAIAVRQVRTRLQDRKTWQGRHRSLAEAESAAQPDFTDLTVLLLHLEGQHRQALEAGRWLDPGERELMSLWMLELAGEMTRAEISEALGISGVHLRVRLQRLRSHLEDGRAIVLALERKPSCSNLFQATEGWDGVPVPLWRKRLARHLRDCRTCSPASASLIPIEKLLGGLMLVPVPVVLASVWMAKVTAVGSSAAGGSGTGLVAWIGQSALVKPLAVVIIATGTVAGAGSTLYVTHHRPEVPKTATPTAQVPQTSSAVTVPPTTTPRKPPAKAVYGSTVDTVDVAPPKNRRPQRLPKRPEGALRILASQDNDPRPDVVNLIHRGENVTYQGRGYLMVEYQLSFTQRSGRLVLPSWTGLQGRLFHVASGGGRRMDDTVPGAADTDTYLGDPQHGYDVLPSGAQQMWQHEFYYLDGKVTLNQNERGADYNLYVHISSWSQAHDDIFTAPSADGVIRYGLTRDDGTDAAPVPQYLTRGHPLDPATVRRVSRLAGGQ